MTTPQPLPQSARFAFGLLASDFQQKVSVLEQMVREDLKLAAGDRIDFSVGLILPAPSEASPSGGPS